LGDLPISLCSFVPDSEGEGWAGTADLDRQRRDPAAEEGELLDAVVQKRRHKAADLKLLRKRLKCQSFVAVWIVTGSPPAMS
jgi:hypothetical protein